MLDAYSYERSTLKTANKLLVHDVYQLVQAKHLQVAKGTRVSSLPERNWGHAGAGTMLLRTGFKAGDREVFSLDETGDGGDTSGDV
jgi:hypothetical protein